MRYSWWDVRDFVRWKLINLAGRYRQWTLNRWNRDD